MSKLLDYYNGEGLDASGRTRFQTWCFTWDQLEGVHDYIQWLFPLEEASRFNPDAPLLTSEDKILIHRHNVAQSFVTMLGFYGFTMTFGREFGRSIHFENRTKVWLTPSNHNFLRITRILKCLCLLDMREESVKFLDELVKLYNEGDNAQIIGETTLRFWKEAVR